MKRQSRGLLPHLKDWWWLYGAASALCGMIVLWGGIPGRIASAEKKIEQVDGDVDDLKGWAREIQGYTRAQQQQQQVPNQMIPAPEVWKARTDEGEVYCTDGQSSWWPTDSGRCE